LVYYIGMNRLNTLFTIYSITAFIIIIERLSPTTQVLLQPHNFIRLHEINQTVIFLTITTILSILELKILTNNFQTLKDKGNTVLLALFVAGVYLYGAGEGWHEVASFTLNTYCNIHQITGNLCNGLFINDFYAGNIIFFIGSVLMNVVLLLFAAKLQMNKWTRKEMTILFVNSIVYAFTWFAYAAFDTVLVGLFFSALLMLVSVFYFLKIKSKWRQYPFLTYNAAAYTLATIGTIIVRFH
jgi:hypothetical protein